MCHKMPRPLPTSQHRNLAQKNTGKTNEQQPECKNCGCRLRSVVSSCVRCRHWPPHSISPVMSSTHRGSVQFHDRVSLFSPSFPEKVKSASLAHTFVHFSSEKTLPPQNGLLIFLGKDTFRNNVVEIVKDFDEKSYNNNGKPWKS